MPDDIAYDPKTETLRLGSGSWAPVRAEVWAYEVGGRNVLESWFNYRKADPIGRRTKKTSPLVDVHPSSWPKDWTLELIDLLTVLTRLVELEQEQDELLVQILNQALATRASFGEGDVAWPATKIDRNPRMPLQSVGGLDLEQTG